MYTIKLTLVSGKKDDPNWGSTTTHEVGNLEAQERIVAAIAGALGSFGKEKAAGGKK